MTARLVCIIVLLCGSTLLGAERDYLDAGEAILIPVGSAGCLGLGELARHFDSTSTSIIRGPLPGETWLHRKLVGRPQPGQSNFLDSDVGSALTPAVCGMLLVGADLSWPRGKAAKDAGQDLLLYLSGLTATKGVTDITKGIFKRPRPLLSLEPELAAARGHSNWSYDHHSFFSGHASSSFFATSFLNLRLRDIMRTELNTCDYRDWRWLPPTLLYGWAGFVSLSRLHAYKHYLSDVLVGATAGWLLAELFYNFAPDVKEQGAGGTPMFVRLSFSF